MIDLIAAAGIGGIIGAGVMAALTVSKIADAQSTDAECTMWEGAWQHAMAAHTRCADALGTSQVKLAKIRELADVPQTLRKADVRAVLDGDA